MRISSRAKDTSQDSVMEAVRLNWARSMRRRWASLCFSDIDRYTFDEAEVRIYFHLVLPDGTEESIPMGIFEVSEANRHIKTLELKAYDYMLRFEKAL